MLGHLAIVPVRALAPLECVERGHLLLGELEVEELRVRFYPRGRGRAREHRAAALQRVAERDLRGTAPSGLVRVRARARVRGRGRVRVWARVRVRVRVRVGVRVRVSLP